MIERVQIKLKQMYGAYSVVGETNELNKRKQNLNNLGERIDFSTNGAGITEHPVSGTTTRQSTGSYSTFAVLALELAIFPETSV